MKSTILLLALAALIFSSCSSAYKTGQTPDDVYFSPLPKGDEYVRTEKKEDKSYKGSDEYYEDRYLRMRVQNRYQWSALDDYYFNNPYAYNYYGSYYNSYSWSSPYNSYWMWNNYYNPYCGSVIIIKNPGRYYVPPARPIAFNLNSYTNSANRTAARRNLNSNYSTNGSRYNNNNSSLSNSVRKVFVNTNSGSNRSYNNSNDNNSTPSRSYNPSSSNSGSRSSSSGSSSNSGGGGGRTRTGR